jgi:hypothetical protein
MTISRNDIGLSEPSDAERVPLGVFGYFQARNRHNAYDLVMEEFASSGLSQADLARRLGRGTDVVCRWLSGPGNWTLDTLSDLLFAISGATPVFGKEHPLRSPPRNQTLPDWLDDTRRKPFDTTSDTVEYPDRETARTEALQ